MHIEDQFAIPRLLPVIPIDVVNRYAQLLQELSPMLTELSAFVERLEELDAAVLAECNLSPTDASFATMHDSVRVLTGSNAVWDVLGDFGIY